MAEFKVVVIGDGGVGKTTFIKRCASSAPPRAYMVNYRYEPIGFTFHTTVGRIKLTVWDTCGSEKFGGLREAYYIGADAAILMFDVTSRITYKNLSKWYHDVTRVCDNIPIVCLGNKVDQKERKVKYSQMTFHRKRHMKYYNLSALANYQYELPYLWILRKLVGDPKLQFTMNMPLKPREIEI